MKFYKSIMLLLCFILALSVVSAVDLYTSNVSLNSWKIIKYNNFGSTFVYNQSVGVNNSAIPYIISFNDNIANSTGLVFLGDEKLVYRQVGNATASLVYNYTFGGLTNIASSSDGKYIYIVGLGIWNLSHRGYILRSSDYGEHFSLRQLSGSDLQAFSFISTTSDGKYVVTTASGTGAGKMLLSSDYGLNAPSVYTLDVGTFEQSCLSPSGNWLWSWTTKGSIPIVTSIDKGANFITSLSGASFTGTNKYVCTDNGLFYQVNYATGSANVLIYDATNRSLISTTTLTLPSVVNDIKIFNNNVYTLGTGSVFYQLINFSYINGSTVHKTRSFALLDSTAIYTTPLCIDEHNLCNYPIYNDGGLYCGINDTTYCSVSCNNNNSTGNLTGICDNGLCINECNIIGYQECDSTTSYKICGNYDTDSCLEYDTGFGCLSGQICKNGYCSSNTGNGMTNNSGFTVTPYSVSDSNTVYLLDAINHKLTVDTKNYIHVQDFSINTAVNTTYSSRTCDYKDTLIGSDVKNIETNETQTIIFTALTQPTKIKASIIPQDNELLIIEIFDSLGNIISNVSMLRNSTAKELCIYNQTTLIYCDYSVNVYDDLVDVDLEFNLEFQSKTYTKSFTIDRTQDYKFSTQPNTFSTNDVSSISLYSDNMTYLNTTVSVYTQPNGFSTTLKADYNYLPCTFTSIGCRNVRTYNNFNGLTDFTNSFDYLICTNSLNNDNPEFSSSTDNFLYGGGLSSGYKYLIVIVVMISLISGFTALGFTINMVQGSFVVGIVFSAFALIFFTVFGWVPVWIMVFLLLVAVATVILISKTNMQNAQG